MLRTRIDAVEGGGDSMRRNFLARLIAATASLLLLTAACSEEPEEPAAPDQVTGEEPSGDQEPFELVIGSLVALTGPFADYGAGLDKAAQLAVDVANEASVEAGANITVTLESADTQGEPQPAVSAARKVVNAGAACLTGTIITPEIVAIAQSLTVQQRIPMVLPFSSSVDVTRLDDDDTVFRTIAPDTLGGYAIADVLEDELGGASGKTVSLAYRNEPYGEGLSEVFSQAWEARGGVVDGPVVFDPDQASYDSEALQIVDGEQDAYLVIDYPDSYAKLGAALVRTGAFQASKLFVTDSLAFDEVPEEIPAEAIEGAIGVIATSPETTAAAEAFDALFSSAPGPERIAYDSNNFDAAMLCFLAAVAAGSNDSSQIADQLRAVANAPGDLYTFEQLPEAIQALQDGTDINYEGVTGPIEWDDRGDLTQSDFNIYTFEDGVRVVLRTIEVTAAG